MKTKALIIIGVAIGLTGTVSAEEGKGKRPPVDIPPEIIAKFDTDGDGKLNEAERKAARGAREEMMKKRKAEMLERFDEDGNGELSEDEKKAMHEEMKKKMLEKFDKDGNGELSEQERAEMRKSMPHRPGGPKGPGPGPREPREPRPNGGDAEAPGAGE